MTQQSQANSPATDRMVGKTYYYLRILQRVDDGAPTPRGSYTNKNGATGKPHVLAECTLCGTQKVIDAGNIRSGLTKSCGCLRGRPRTGSFRKDTIVPFMFRYGNGQPFEYDGQMYQVVPVNSNQGATQTPTHSDMSHDMSVPLPDMLG